jgi:pimeloyl-ACP methyl ester carboxylesterase
MKILLQLSLFISFVCLASCGNHKKENAFSQQLDLLEGTDTVTASKYDKLTYTEAYNKSLKLWQTSFEEKDIKTTLGNAHVITCGPVNAPALILLHGMNASSTMWYPNIKALSSSYRIYAIDFLLEPGKSLCVGDVSSTDAVVNWYYEIFDQLKLKKFSILGASRGGWLAVNIALHSPERINKIALLSPAQTFIWIKPLPKVISNITYSINPKRKKLRNVLETMTANVDNISQVYINQYYIATEEATTNRCIMQMTPFSDDQLRSLKMPVLVLIGDNDIINDEGSLKKAKKLIPNADTDVIKNAGHFLSMDQADIINRRVLSFLGAGSLSARKQ